MTTQDEALYRNVGRLTRQLHEALRELGYDRALGDAVGSLPDARDRLSYISRLTGEAAEKVLNGVDRTKEELDRLAAGARDAAGALCADPVSAVASGSLLRYLEEVGASTGRADRHLTDIMLAQDFHDLTGQVIRRIVAIAQSLEGQLLRLLVETGSPEAGGVHAAASGGTASGTSTARSAAASPAGGTTVTAAAATGMTAATAAAAGAAAVTAAVTATASSVAFVPSLDGPAMSPEGRTDVVADQSQVDDLLASLGF